MDPGTILTFLAGTDDDSIVFQISALESLNESLAMSQARQTPQKWPDRPSTSTLRSP